VAWNIAAFTVSRRREASFVGLAMALVAAPRGARKPVHPGILLLPFVIPSRGQIALTWQWLFDLVRGSSTGQR